MRRGEGSRIKSRKDANASLAGKIAGCHPLPLPETVPNRWISAVCRVSCSCSMAASRGRGEGYAAVYYPRGGTWLYRVPISTEMVDGGWRSLNRGGGIFPVRPLETESCWIGAREINKISIRSLYDTFSRTSLGHQRKIVIGSLKNVRSALYADYGMLCQECFQRVRWRVRDAYKCRLRRASECAGRRRTSRYTRVSNHRADIWQGRKGSLSLSLSREDLIKFFWPRRFILKTIPLLFRSDNPFVPIKMNAPYRQHVNLNMIHGRGKL